MELFSNQFKRSVTGVGLSHGKDAENKGLKKLPEWWTLVFDQENSMLTEIALVTTQAIREYLILLWKQYKTSPRDLKTQILDEICRNLKVHRKSAIRLMARKYPPRSLQGFQGGRKREYSERSKKHLARLWQSMTYMCAERMHVALPEWLAFDDHVDCDAEVKTELLTMSISSIRRFLAPERAKLQRKMNTGTRRGVKKFITKVPVRSLGERFEQPGHCEIDCVAHCGGSLSGQFAWTLTLTDIVTGWTECEALWAKDSVHIARALRHIEKRLPFPLLALYSDNGAEFMNERVIDIFTTQNRSTLIQYFRGRPYKKNDQAYVEQKNYTHVRHLFGYGRIDKKESIAHMNSIYRQEWRLLQNHFLPQQKLLMKERHNAKIIRKMSRAQTPYERLRPFLNDAEQRKLEREHALINPFNCRKGQLAKIRQLNRFYHPDINKLEWGKAAR